MTPARTCPPAGKKRQNLVLLFLIICHLRTSPVSSVCILIPLEKRKPPVAKGCEKLLDARGREVEVTRVPASPGPRGPSTVAPHPTCPPAQQGGGLEPPGAPHPSHPLLSVLHWLCTLSAERIFHPFHSSGPWPGPCLGPCQPSPAPFLPCFSLISALKLA